MVLQRAWNGLSGVEVNTFRLGPQKAEAHAEAGHARRTRALQAAAAQHVHMVCNEAQQQVQAIRPQANAHVGVSLKLRLVFGTYMVTRPGRAKTWGLVRFAVYRNALGVQWVAF